MMKKLIMLILCGFFAQCVYAQENCIAPQPQGVSPQNIPAKAGCSCVTANKVGASVEIHQEYTFGEHTFKDGQIELAISETRKKTLVDAAQIADKQVTFNRNHAKANCFFSPIALVQGGVRENYWGWHLLWAEAGAGLFYARMDGEAWVSSLPKSLSKLSPINPQFKLENQTIRVTWQQVENGVTASMQATSSDEGRSWDTILAQP
jgi:hypothetical protein